MDLEYLRKKWGGVGFNRRLREFKYLTGPNRKGLSLGVGVGFGVWLGLGVN